MKTAVYIREGVTQIVLTPETDLEKSVLNIVERKAWPSDGQQVKALLHRGSFYDCMGGWTRQGEEETSLIIRVEKEIALEKIADA
jgi:hypothetical protein